MTRRLGSTLAFAALVGLVVTLGCRKSADQFHAEPAIDVPAEDLKALVEGNNEFAIDLYKSMAETEKGNICISPYSVSSALAMAYAGAKGETAEEMKRALHLDLPPEQVHPAFGALRQSLGRADSGVQIKQANALWIQEGNEFHSDYLRTVKPNYRGAARSLDFQHKSEASRQTINGWVGEQTVGRIPELLKRGALPSITRVVLTNAIYFNGRWAVPFDKAATRDESFECTPSKRRLVPMMHRHGAMRYAMVENFRLLELPYEGERFSMVVILPKKRHELKSVEHMLTGRVIEQAMRRSAETEIALALPRFHSETNVLLNGNLIALGMPTPFNESADFSAMTSTGLRIGAVRHACDVEVHEEGTVAAAATAVIMWESARSTTTVVCDEPFFYALIDRKSSSLVFCGRKSE